MLDATQQQLEFMDSELPRFLQSGAWEQGQSNIWVSRMFLVPKRAKTNGDSLSTYALNKYCKDHNLTYKTLKHLKNITRAGDMMVSFDLADGYYTLGIREEDRDFFTVNYCGTLYRLAGLPMGWKCNDYYFAGLPKFLSVTYANRCPTPRGTPPAYLRANSPRDRNLPDAICETHYGKALAYSRTWTTSFFMPTSKTQLYISTTASHPYSTASD
jgi:hypothetical protein